MHRRMRGWSMAFMIATALVPAGARADGEDARELRAKKIKTSEVAATAEKTFGLHLLRAMVERDPGRNVFISPLSIFLVLQMAGDGASGSTRAAMLKALALPRSDRDTLDASAQALQSLLKSGEGGKLNIANAIWADRRAPLAPAFTRLCESVFGAHAASLNLAGAGAARQINDWVSENTRGKINNIVTPDSVAKAAVVLTNAVYFKGTWDVPFSPSSTVNASFHKPVGDKTVPMMHKARIAGAYRSGANFEGAMLDYQDSGLFFYALLPQKGKTPADVLASIDPVRFASGSSEADLDLKLPRFTLNFTSTLNKYLENMGMDVAFRFPAADFSVMGSKQFFIGEVIHKTRLEVDEEGTVAAAATAVQMRAGSAMRRQPPPLKTLVFNRPFVILIGDSSTGALIFAGVVENP